MKDWHNTIDKDSIDESIGLLRQYMDEADIAPLLSVLQEISQDPDNATLETKLRSTFDELGFAQGAVLTYAPYIAVVLSDDPHIRPEDRD